MAPGMDATEMLSSLTVDMMRIVDISLHRRFQVCGDHRPGSAASLPLLVSVGLLAGTVIKALGDIKPGPDICRLVPFAQSVHLHCRDGFLTN